MTAIALPNTFVPGEIAEAVKVNENFETLKAALEAGGYGASSQIAKWTAGEETRTEEEGKKVTEYFTMPTKDEVTILVPPETLLAVAFLGVMTSSEAGKGKAALFFNGVQLKNNANTPAVQAVTTSGTTANLFGAGTSGLEKLAATAYTGDTGTPQPMGIASEGNVCLIRGLSGTVKVSVRFLAETGTLKVKERKLSAWIP